MSSQNDCLATLWIVGTDGDRKLHSQYGGPCFEVHSGISERRHQVCGQLFSWRKQQHVLETKRQRILQNGLVDASLDAIRNTVKN